MAKEAYKLVLFISYYKLMIKLYLIMFTDAEACYNRENLEVITRLRQSCQTSQNDVLLLYKEKALFGGQLAQHGGQWGSSEIWA